MCFMLAICVPEMIQVSILRCITDVIWLTTASCNACATSPHKMHSNVCGQQCSQLLDIHESAVPHVCKMQNYVECQMHEVIDVSFDRP